MNARTQLSPDRIAVQVASIGSSKLPATLSTRIAELKALKNGWFNGIGLAPRHDDLGWLESNLDENYPPDLPSPFLYPTVEGGIRIEWSLPPFEVSLEIEADARSGNWHSLNIQDDSERIEVLDLARREGWMWLAREMRAAAEVGR